MARPLLSVSDMVTLGLMTTVLILAMIALVWLIQIGRHQQLR
jgi:hypothetical protein